MSIKAIYSIKRQSNINCLNINGTHKTLPQITKHLHESQNTTTNHKTLPQITKHLLGWKPLARKKAIAGWKTLAWVAKHLPRSKTILLIQTLSRITKHFHKYETPPQITKHLHNHLSYFLAVGFP